MKTFVFYDYEDIAEDRENPLPALFAIPEPVNGKSGYPFFIPEFAGDFRPVPLYGIRISKVGKSISERFAPRYYSEHGVALLMVATDMLDTLREKGLPWIPAVAYDRSCVLGEFHSPDGEAPAAEISFGIHDRENEVSMLTLRCPDRRTICRAIGWLSRTTSLKTGDLLLFALTHPDYTLRPGMSLTLESLKLRFR